MAFLEQGFMASCWRMSMLCGVCGLFYFMGCAAFQLDSPAPYTLNPGEFVMCSGLRWDIRTGDVIQGAGPNYWGGVHDYVVPHRSGVRLHVKPDASGRWRSSEISTPIAPGTTHLKVTFTGLPKHLDPNLVLGVFVYRDDTSEFDFEMSTWGHTAHQPLQFVMVPAWVPEHIHRFDPAKPEMNSVWTQVFEWGPRTLRATLYQDGIKVASWLYKGRDVPEYASHRLHINLWLLRGEPPLNTQPVSMDVVAVEMR